MKAIFSCLMLITFFTFQTSGINVCEIQIPEKVIKSFQKKYPKNTEASWDDLGDMFVVNFYDEGDVLKEANFDPEGNWQETITVLDEDELPKKIITFIENKYRGDAELYDVIFSEKPEGNFYFVNIDIMEMSEDEETESQSITLTFDDKGKFLKQD